MSGCEGWSLLIGVGFLSDLDDVKGAVVDEKGDGPKKLDHASGSVTTLSELCLLLI